MRNMATVGPVVELAALLDRTANDPSLDPPRRVANLRALREDLNGLLGQADSYLSDQELLRESDAIDRVAQLMSARENADVRQRLLERGAATPEQLDAAGYLSHRELDSREADGTLEETLFRGFLPEAMLRETWSQKARDAALAARRRNAEMRKSMEPEDDPAVLHREWADLDRRLLPYAGNPNAPEARRIVAQQEHLTKLLHHRYAAGTFNPAERGAARDVVVVGAGPAGMSAAIYGATEGLDTLMVDAQSGAGGQAGLSSRIENVIGFPTGVTGRQLAKMSLEQVQRVGADTKFGEQVKSMTYDPKTGLKHLEFDDGRTVDAKAVVLAGGVQFRRLGVPGEDHPGIVYGDSSKLKAIPGDKVIVGGANSAGQAAVDAASKPGHVTILIRKGSIRDGMSQYLVDQLENNPKVSIVTGAVGEVNADDAGSVTGVTLKDGRTIGCTGVGVFIGSAPKADWAGVERDERGYVKANPETLETSIPGVYAAGDLRSGSTHRVIMAAGDGAHAISVTHSYLASLREKNVSEARSEKRSARPQRNNEPPDDEADRWMHEVVMADEAEPFTGGDEGVDSDAPDGS